MIRICLIILMIFFIPLPDGFACTIFSIKTKENFYYCNHEDYWEYETRLWIRPGKDGKYGAIYYGFHDWRQEWVKKTFADKPELMVDDFLPDGGMNEKGLSWDWVADGTDWGSDSFLPDYDRSHPFHDIIQQYSTIDEAIDFIRKFNFKASGRTLMSDRFGNSAIIYKLNGRLMVERATKNFQILGYGKRTSGHSMLKMGKYFNIKQIADILNASHQGDVNQYSNINDPKDRIIYLFHFQNFEEYIKIDMLHEFKFGEKTYSIPSLFSKIKILPPTIIRKGDSVSATFKWRGKSGSIYKLYYSTDRKFDSYEAVDCIYSSSFTYDYALLGLSIPAYFLLGGIKRKKKYFLALLMFIFLASTNCGTTQRSEYKQYKRNLPKVETKEFSITIDNLMPNTTYYLKIVARPKGNDHFLSESFVYSFTAE